MNVWIVNPFDNLPLEGNRPQRYWLMARAFAQAGHRVTLWTSDFSHATKARRVLRTAMASVACADSGEGFTVRLIPTLPYPTNVCLARIRSHRQLARDFEKLAHAAVATPISQRSSSQLPNSPHPNLVIASTPPLGLCAAALRVARACGAHFVCDIQDAWPETFGRLLPRGFKWAGRILFAPMRMTARRIYREADIVTGVCRRYDELSGRDDFYLAYLGIEGEGRRTKDEGGIGGAIRLAYIGNLGNGYDLETVLAAVSRRPDLTLDIAGAGPTEENLRHRIRALKLESRVRFRGFLEETALRALLAQCDVGVIPMRDDSWVGLPNKLVDYLASGLTVVSSLHGECGELLSRTGFGRTYDWGNADSFLAALDDLPPATVTLPDELCAERIYPRYVARLTE